MLYVQQFHHSRQDQLNEYQRLRSAADQNFVLCSNQYATKLTQLSRRTSRATIATMDHERTGTLLLLTRISSLMSLNNNNNNDLSILNIRATSWNPQQSRITRENKDYMTALAKGITRNDAKQLSNENSEVFSSRWHHHLSNGVQRPSTGKAGSRGSRPPTAAPERGKTSVSTLIEFNRPTTAPVNIEQRPRRINTAKVKSAAPARPPPTPGPLRAHRIIDSSGNFDNLTSSAFLHLTDGVKPTIYKSDNHFVHQLCTNINDTMTDHLSTSRDSIFDASDVTLPNETINEKEQSNETTISDQDENKNSLYHIANLGTWQRDAKSGRIEAVAVLPSRKTPHEDPEEIERRIIEKEEEELRQRQNDIDQYTFDFASDCSTPTYDYKYPFTEEYDQAISLQPQCQTNNGYNEWNLKEFYRDVEAKLEEGSNTKAVFEKCIKLARLQANTIKWEQRRRQNLNAYNRLLRNNALDTSTSNLTASFSSKTNNNEKEMRELNELKRELRCNECKRITCLGNCAPGQDYHLYKRIISTIPSQSASTKQPSQSTSTKQPFQSSATKQPSPSSSAKQPAQPSSTRQSFQSSSSKQLSASIGSVTRDQHRCKHGCTICSTSQCRTTADIINSNAIITNLSNTNNRLRSSKTTYSYGQKSQRPTVDLRPRSMYQVTREMKIKFEQANLSPVVVVPLFEDQSQSMLNKRLQKKAINGLLPGKSFRSQRRDSLTLASAQKLIS